MRFCPECESKLTKTTTPTGISFHCHCSIIIEGSPDDTLMYEENMSRDNSANTHSAFIENAPYDLAGNTIYEDCPKCKLNFVTLIRTGVDETSMRVCSCGYIST